MTTFDILMIPSCRAAAETRRFSHSDLKNVFAVFADDVLGSWILDDGEFHRFQEAANRVCEGLWGFSPAELVRQLRPLSALPLSQREALRDSLDLAFTASFRPVEVRERLNTKVQSLFHELRTFRSSVREAAESSSLNEIRALAALLREELDLLPSGFWLPGPDSFIGSETRA